MPPNSRASAETSPATRFGPRNSMMLARSEIDRGGDDVGIRSLLDVLARDYLAAHVEGLRRHVAPGCSARCEQCTVRAIAPDRRERTRGARRRRRRLIKLIGKKHQRPGRLFHAADGAAGSIG